MVTNEKLNKLYDSLFYQDELSLEKLFTLGFDESDLSYLINTKILIKENDNYKIASVRGLYNFSMKLIKEKQIDKAKWYLEKILELSPDNPRILLQLFLRNVEARDYNEAFNYLERMFNCETNYFKNDCYFYLFLLNMITEVPDNFKLMSKNISYNYFKLKEYDKDDILNKVRFNAGNQKFYLALKQYREYINSKDKRNGQDILLENLLYQAKQKQLETYQKVLDLVQSKKYEEVVNLLEGIQKRHKLINHWYYILSLTKDLINIKSNKRIPDSRGITTNHFFKAIESKDYEYALSLIDNIKLYDKSRVCLELLLKDIIEEINKIKTENEVKTDDEIDKIDKDILVIINSLRRNDIDISFSKIKEFLSKFNKSGYEFLIQDLVKLSLIENDNYCLVINILSLIKEDNFTFNLAFYIQKFYEKVVLNQYREANIYLDIIEKCEKIGISCIFKSSLKQVLVDSEKEYNLLTHKSNLKKLLENKLEEAVNYGVSSMVLENEEVKEEIDELMRYYSYFKIFEIDKQLVFKFNPYNYDSVNIKELLDLGKLAYNNEEYSMSIKYYRGVLEGSKDLSYVYSKIGLAYLKLDQNEVAASYLTVATHLSKIEGTDYDYTDLIDKLRNTRKVENNYLKKPVDDNMENYQVDNLEDILSLEEEGNNILEVFDSLNLDNDKRVVVLIELAKKYYQKGIDIKAESFMKMIEKIRNKSKYVRYLYEDVKRNKMLYKKRR